MKAFRELGLYGERRRNQPASAIADIFPGIYCIREVSYTSQNGFQQCSLGIYLTQIEPICIITLEQAINVSDGFTAIHMKVVSTEPEKVVEEIKIKAPYLQDYEFPLGPIAAS